MRSVPGAVATGLQYYLLAGEHRSRYKTRPVWNDTDIALGYLITFRCYGTWLHGDERGSIDRFHNRYKSPYIDPNERWHRHNAQVLEGKPSTLEGSQRQSVEVAIRETCAIRRWHLYALNVRTNHIHAVVSIGPIKPEGTLT